MFSNISDCHNHSNCSFDGRDSALDMCKRGAELGLLYHTITDHCECEEYLNYPRDYKSAVKKAYEQITKLKEEFSGLLLGIELGQTMQNLPAAEEVLKNSYDFVLGSLHSLKGGKDFYYWNDLGLDVYEALDTYFQELKEMIEWGKFDSLAHLTYPLRYIVGENSLEVDFLRYIPTVTDIYKLVIKKGIAIEVNTSGLRQKIGETLPNFQLLKLYREMGGSLVTIGSDSHRAADLGKGIQEGLQILQNAGFKEYTVFKNRKPVMIEIK